MDTETRKRLVRRLQIVEGHVRAIQRMVEDPLGEQPDGWCSGDVITRGSLRRTGKRAQDDAALPNNVQGDPGGDDELHARARPEQLAHDLRNRVGGPLGFVHEDRQLLP